MQMQERMKTMQEQMSRIHQTQDPQERKKLMEEHMQTMQEQMKDMRGMGGGMMMGIWVRAVAECTRRARWTRRSARK